MITWRYRRWKKTDFSGSFIGSVVIRLCSSTDRVPVFETGGGGSNPPGGTFQRAHLFVHLPAGRQVLVPPARDCEASGCLPLDKLGDHAKQPPESTKRCTCFFQKSNIPVRRHTLTRTTNKIIYDRRGKRI